MPPPLCCKLSKIKPVAGRKSITVATMASASTTIQELNKEYEVRHRAFEDNFWATKMGLKVTAASSAELAPML